MTSLAADNDSLACPGLLGQQLPSFKTKGNKGWGDLFSSYSFDSQVEEITDHPGCNWASPDSVNLGHQIVCGKLLRVFVCRLLHCTTRVQISDVLTAATRFPSYKSMTTTVIVRWENISWHFHPLSLKWLGWVRWARHLCLSQWKILLRECWAQGHGHSLRQGEWKFSGF